MIHHSERSTRNARASGQITSNFRTRASWRLSSGSNNQNGNLRWFLPLGVAPPPLMAQISRHFVTPLFSFAIESYIYETDFTLLN